MTSATVTSNQPHDMNRLHDNVGQLPKLKKREVYRYEASWPVSSVAWCNDPSNGGAFDLALSSYLEDRKNHIALVRLAKDEFQEEVCMLNTFDHPFPATKVMWAPRNSLFSSSRCQWLATSADHLRLWKITDLNSDNVIERDWPGKKAKAQLECLLSTQTSADKCVPVTSFDWNEVDTGMIVTSSVDTTCAIWDLHTGQQVNAVTTNNVSFSLRSRIVAHNHEVYDVCFSPLGSGRDVFVSAGGDGSMRLFDLRQLSTSTILFDSGSSIQSNTNSAKSVVRVACNKINPNMIGALCVDSNDIVLLDPRAPGRVLATLTNHVGQPNSISWAPHSAHHLCSASDDHQALIWELSSLPERPVDEPLLAYRAKGRIQTISWSAAHTDWIAIGYGHHMELLRV